MGLQRTCIFRAGKLIFILHFPVCVKIFEFNIKRRAQKKWTAHHNPLGWCRRRRPHHLNLYDKHLCTTYTHCNVSCVFYVIFMFVKIYFKKKFAHFAREYISNNFNNVFFYYSLSLRLMCFLWAFCLMALFLFRRHKNVKFEISFAIWFLFKIFSDSSVDWIRRRRRAHVISV